MNLLNSKKKIYTTENRHNYYVVLFYRKIIFIPYFKFLYISLFVYSTLIQMTELIRKRELKIIHRRRRIPELFSAFYICDANCCSLTSVRSVLYYPTCRRLANGKVQLCREGKNIFNRSFINY